MADSSSFARGAGRGLALHVLWLCATSGHAQTAAGILVGPVDIERRQAQEIEAHQTRVLQRPDVLSPETSASGGPLRFPNETPCFVINKVQWDGPRQPDNIKRAGSQALTACVGAGGLRALQEHLQGLLLDDGLVTSRVLVQEQSLAAGKLTLRYLPGRIADIQGEGAVGWWRTVLPTWPGGELNQRGLDQALENVRRLAGQADATIDVAPGPEPGDSNIIIKPGTGKRWHGYIGGDNAGTDTIGKYQVNAGLTLDSPLYLYDQLSVSWNSNADWRDGLSNTRAASINYSVPLGYWSLFAGASQSTYRQTVAGFEEPIIYGGATKQVQAGVSVVPYRATAYKGTATFSVSRKRVSSTLNDVDIDVQRRDVTGYGFDLNHRHYLEKAVLDVGGGVRGTLPGLSDRPGFVYEQPDWDGRSTLLVANAGVYLPFSLADQQLAYQGTWQMQHARTPIVPSDYFSIGNRYSVRGFDGQMTLAAEDGWSLRNDVALNLNALGAPNQQAYVGLDIGRVGGESARYLTSRTLAGAVVGLRGRVAVPYAQLSYDLSVGWPLKKPESLKAAHTVVAATVMLSF